MDPLTQIAGLAAALALAGAAGLRTFLPLFAVAALGWLQIIAVAPAMGLIATGPAVLVLAALVVLEGVRRQGPRAGSRGGRGGLLPQAGGGHGAGHRGDAPDRSGGGPEGWGPWRGASPPPASASPRGGSGCCPPPPPTAWGTSRCPLLEDWAALVATAFALVAPILGIMGLTLIAAMLIGAEAWGRRARWARFAALPSLH